MKRLAQVGVAGALAVLIGLRTNAAPPLKLEPELAESSKTVLKEGDCPDVQPSASRSKEDCTLGPCICPHTPIEIESTKGYMCHRYADDCGCNDGTCQNPENHFFPTSASVEWPQDCDDPGVPCDFTESSKKYEDRKAGGLESPCDEDFEPKFPELEDQGIRVTEIYDAKVRFGPVHRFMRTARVFLYYIPAHNDHRGVPTPARTLAIGAEIDSDSEAAVDFEVEMKHVKMYESHEFVCYINTGGVVYPVYIAERKTSDRVPETRRD